MFAFFFLGIHCVFPVGVGRGGRGHSSLQSAYCFQGNARNDPMKIRCVADTPVGSARGPFFFLFFPCFSIFFCFSFFLF